MLCCSGGMHSLAGYRVLGMWAWTACLHLSRHALFRRPPAASPPAVQVYQRILKHLAATSPYLVDPVWHK